LKHVIKGIQVQPLGKSGHLQGSSDSPFFPELDLLGEQVFKELQRLVFFLDGGVRQFLEDIKGFCNSADIKRVAELDYLLMPRRYVGLPEEEDDFDFKERFTRQRAEFEEQLKEEAV
jgi:type I restriction-modification system DNA methylase subunit